MIEVLTAMGLWVGASVVAVLMFVLGALFGRRGAWEDGYERGLQVGMHLGGEQLRRHGPPGGQQTRAS